MIFLGDLACPHEKASAFSKCVDNLDALKNQTVIINLEGVLLNENDTVKHESLYNSVSIIDALSRTNKCIVSLANNHMYDYPEKIAETNSILCSKGIGVFGLYNEMGEIRPFEYVDEDGKEYAFFGHCWRLYSKTNPNNINSVRIVDCDYQTFYETVRKYVNDNPEKRTVCFMHWNYDFEKLPFPMIVLLSHDLIDAGVFSVIGNHCHRTQGVEIYKNKVIAYCLGNFYIPSGIFYDGRLIYPDYSKECLGIDYKNDDIYSIWFESDKNGGIVKELSTSPVSEDKRLRGLLPATNDIKKYTRYFKKNREKKFLVPVFKQYRGKSAETLAVCRIKAVKTVQRLQKG